MIEVQDWNLELHGWKYYRSRFLAVIMGSFDFSSDEESRTLKIGLLYNTYGLDSDHGFKEWHDYKLILTYQKRLRCSKDKLLKEFEKAFPKTE